MTPDEFAERMRQLAADKDVDGRHEEADQLMRDILKEFGYTEGVQIFLDMNRWYS